MNSSLLSAMICISGIVIAAAVVLVITLLRPKSDKAKNARITSAETDRPKRTSWQHWLLPVGVACILAIWTIWGALFFLAVVWVLRMNPSSDASFTISNNEKKTAQRVYTWLFFSPIITVPIFIAAASNVYSRSTINERVFTALIPLIMHTPVLLGLTSKSVFVYRHTQQGILLIALRAGMASLAVVNLEDHIDYALLLFLLGNGTLWLVSSLIGWSQISNHRCWLLERKGEKILSPESIPPEITITPIEDKELDDMIQSLDAPGMHTARQKAIHAFRTGTPEIKKRAIAVLSQLGEVEKF